MENCSRTMEQQIPKNKEHRKELEYNRLRTVIPRLAEKQSVSKIEVVEEAINYIAQLQHTLSNYHEVTSEELQQQFLERERRRRLLIREKTRRIPSYHRNNIRRKATTMQEPKHKNKK